MATVRPSAESARLAERYLLALAQQAPRGPAGDLLGRGTGASLEFQDRREYVSGDDLRHLDWRAYARTDELQVRMYREEIEPRVEVLLDASRSMGTDAAKAALAVDLTAFLARAARGQGFAARLVVLGAEPRRIELEELEGAGVDFDGAQSLGVALERGTPILSQGCMRYLVSDLLVPEEPRALVRRLAGRAHHLRVLQVLSRGDAEPREGEALRLTDSESGDTLDLVLDAGSVAAYGARLESLCASWATECTRAGASCTRLVARGELDALCRAQLVPAGVLEPR